MTHTLVQVHSWTDTGDQESITVTVQRGTAADARAALRRRLRDRGANWHTDGDDVVIVEQLLTTRLTWTDIDETTSSNAAGSDYTGPVEVVYGAGGPYDPPGDPLGRSPW